MKNNSFDITKYKKITENITIYKNIFTNENNVNIILWLTKKEMINKNNIIQQIFKSDSDYDTKVIICKGLDLNESEKNMIWEIMNKEYRGYGFKPLLDDIIHLLIIKDTETHKSFLDQNALYKLMCIWHNIPIYKKHLTVENTHQAMRA